MQESYQISRRAVLGTGITASVGILAGCTEPDDSDDSNGDDSADDGDDDEGSTTYNVVGNSVEEEHIIEADQPHVTEERSVAIEWTFDSDITLTDGFGSASAGPGEIIFIQDVTVRNVGDEAFSFMIPGFFRLVDEDGSEYRPDVASESPGQMNPGITGTARLVFVLPQMEGKRLALRVDGQQIFTLEKARWIPYGELDLTAPW